MIRAFKFRAYCNPTTEKNALRWLDLCRSLYNAALEQRIMAWQQQRKSLSAFTQQYDLKYLRAEFPEYADVGSQVLKDVIRRLGKTYDAFFRRIKQGQGKAGFPKFKGSRYYTSFTFPNASGWKLHLRYWSDQGWKDITNQAEIPPYAQQVKWPRVEYGSLRPRLYLDIKNLGVFKLRGGRIFPRAAVIRTVTVRRESTGKWFVVFSCDEVPIQPLPEVNRSIALDLGVKRFLTDSDGNVVDNPQFFKKYAGKLRILNRKLARQKDGSKRKEATYQERRLLYEKMVRVREFFHCQTALHYARTYDTIVVEDLSIKKMIEEGKRKRGLSGRIADVAWGMFLQRLENKCEEFYRDYEKVDPAYTTRTCNHCGYCHHRPITTMTFKCPECGNEDDRPFNSALNIEDVAEGNFEKPVRHTGRALT
jgi:putative transposase